MRRTHLNRPIWIQSCIVLPTFHGVYESRPVYYVDPAAASFGTQPPGRIDQSAGVNNERAAEELPVRPKADPSQTIFTPHPTVCLSDGYERSSCHATPLSRCHTRTPDHHHVNYALDKPIPRQFRARLSSVFRLTPCFRVKFSEDTRDILTGK